MAAHTYTRPTNLDHSPERFGRPNLSRRALALGAGAASAIGITAGVAASMPVNRENLHGFEHPDAELITLCREHVANLHAFNAHGDLDNPDCPFWAPYDDTKHAISGAEPQTLAGMVAKAWAAKAEAALPDGSEDPAGGPAEDWAWDLVNDLLRVAGEA